MLGDAVSAFGVVIAGVLVATTRTPLADPIVSLLIAALILYSSYGVLRESATVLLEGTPAGIDMPAVIAAIKSVAGVLDVHDLHVWMVGPGVVACSCHILVAEQSVREGQQVLRAVVHDIEHRFHITHTTVQVEVEGCDANDMYLHGAALAHPGGPTLIVPSRRRVRQGVFFVAVPAIWYDAVGEIRSAPTFSSAGLSVTTTGTGVPW